MNREEVKVVVAYLTYYSNICLGIKKSPKYESRVLTIRAQRSVFI
jgi:hypothetical protein